MLRLHPDSCALSPEQAPDRQTPRFSVAMVLLLGPDGRPSYPVDAPKIASIVHPDARPDAGNDVKVRWLVFTSLSAPFTLFLRDLGFEAGLKFCADVPLL